MLFHDIPHELAWNWHIYWEASQILVCSESCSLICGGFQLVMTLWLYSLRIIQMMQRVCVERCSCVGLSGHLTSRGLWTGSLRERWWFESRTSIRQWVTERRLVLFHDRSRHHRTLVPSVVLGHCSRLFRKGNVTWVKKHQNLEFRIIRWAPGCLCRLQVPASEEQDGQTALRGHATAGTTNPSTPFSTIM